MAEGLLLDGINLESGGRSVAEAEEFAALIDADETETGLAGADVAMARTEIAMEAAIGIGRPPEGFVEGGGFLEDLQFGHGLRLLKLVYAWENRKKFTSENTQAERERRKEGTKKEEDNAKAQRTQRFAEERKAKRDGNTEVTEGRTQRTQRKKEQEKEERRR